MLNTPPALFDPIIGSRFVVFGHSLATGGGSTTPDAGFPDYVGSALRAPVTDLAIGGAVLAVTESGRPESNVMDGGWVSIYQRAKSPRAIFPYLPQPAIFHIHYGNNDLGWGKDLIVYRNALRSVISRLMSSRSFDDPDPSLTYPVAWGSAVTGQTLSNSGTGYRSDGANGAQARIVMPADYPGGQIVAASLIAKPSSSGSVSWTLNGTALTVAQAPAIPTATTCVGPMSNDASGASQIMRGQTYKISTSMRNTPQVYRFDGLKPSRQVTDAVTNATTTVTSATAAFVSTDVGRSISGGTIPANAVINSVTNATTVVISAAASGSASGVTVTIADTLVATVANIAAATSPAQPTVTPNVTGAASVTYEVVACFGAPGPLSGADGYTPGGANYASNTAHFTQNDIGLAATLNGTATTISAVRQENAITPAAAITAGSSTAWSIPARVRDSMPSTTRNITNSATTTNNTITWTAVPGAVGYKIVRTAGGPSQGQIGYVQANHPSYLTFTDTNIAATAYTPAGSQPNLDGFWFDGWWIEANPVPTILVGNLFKFNSGAIYNSTYITPYPTDADIDTWNAGVQATLTEYANAQYIDVDFMKRVVNDAVTNGTTTLTSASANFSALRTPNGDVGRTIYGTNIPAGTTITAVNSATSITMSAAATGSATGGLLDIHDPNLFGPDGIHPNDRGHAKIAVSIINALNAAFVPTSTETRLVQNREPRYGERHVYKRFSQYVPITPFAYQVVNNFQIPSTRTAPAPLTINDIANNPVPMQLPIIAQPGDTLETYVEGVWSNENLQVTLDFATWVSGAAVNYISSGATPQQNIGMMTAGIAGYQGLVNSRTLAATGATTSGSAVVTVPANTVSASEVGRVISGTNVPVGSTIVAILSSTTILISATASATGSTIAFTIGAQGGINLGNGRSEYQPFHSRYLYVVKANDIAQTGSGTGVQGGLVTLQLLSWCAVPTGSTATQRTLFTAGGMSFQMGVKNLGTMSTAQAG